jgi:hypothetical protein
MPADDRTRRWGCRFLLVLALGIPCLIAGCGDGGGTQPAGFDEAQKQKVKEYLGGYREQLIAEAKSKAKAKAKDAVKKSP